MTSKLRVILEIGTKGRRVVAAATDWPGLDRWGKTEDDALEKLSAYIPRYVGVAERADLADDFERQRTIEVVERYPGSSSTDFWGIAHVPSEIERDVLSPTDLDRRIDLLRASWAYFDDVAAHVSAELRPQPRGGGRSRDSIIRHTYGTEPENWSKKVGVKTPLDVVLTPEGLTTHRQEYADAIRAYNAEGKPARTWPIQFLIRRTAHHVMDHAWEMEDRDLTS
ncbi:MAG: hypothetical protein H0W10_08265 [Chloroflexi bacterium]|nr:hypothetical protein [Chloroflexota bacterium]